jgi:UDP-glucuronate decarboxylase
MALGDGRVVSNFIVQALTGQDITIQGDGSQTRSFCYVDDLVDGLVRMMESDDFTGPVNLGNPVEFTILSLAETVIRATGSSSKIAFKPLPADDPHQRKPDISLAGARLGWEPRVPFEQGLARTIAYFEERLRTRGTPA